MRIVASPLYTLEEADDVLQRLDRHNQEKDFWQQVIVFTSQNNTLNKAEVRYLEAKLVELAIKNKRM